MKKVCVIAVVLGSLGVFCKGFEKHMSRLGLNARPEVIQKTALLGTARILRKVVSM